MMWLLTVPVWTVALLAFILAAYGFGRALKLAEHGPGDIVAAHVFTACGFAIASSILAALAVAIGRL